MENVLKRITFPIINAWGQRKLDNQNFSKEPILVGGCARSGTTLLISILSAHPSIFTFPKELMAFIKWNNRESENPAPRRIDRLHRQVIITNFPEEAKRWCEKSAQNCRHFGQILNYFNEQVKLIHIVRDGRDVITSRHPDKPDNFWVEPERWVYDVQSGLEFVDHPNLVTVKYEDIVQNYDDTVRNLFDFLGEEYHENLQEYHKHADIKKARGWFHPVKEVHGNSIGRWQKEEYRERYELAREIPGFLETLERAGYDTGAE
ncbi:MAG: sulfotransferase [Candidatus Marinimicrobia bacterium]|nr:sulfotransferase [Candidatus Neomarinimicrobiota bacterium]MCF7829253.1 sulfotransferase [Candidatus Neomarinimicrobiota bacterium]MCF7881094.1 sulfotransferase [Candidatus Neomarinimicrobiota bacterium]